MEQKKRKKGLIIGGIAAGVVVVGLFMCWLMGFFGGISSVKQRRSLARMRVWAMQSILSPWTRSLPAAV